MTIEERLAALEKRLAQIEQITTPLMPLGPSLQDQKEFEREQKAVIKKISSFLIGKKSEISPPVDRSARALTERHLEENQDYREINPTTGQQKAYVILNEEERAKGFVRPVRQTYTHKSCGTDTTMALSIAETYARDPGFYSGTFCVKCRGHLPLTEFVWKDTDEQVGS